MLESGAKRRKPKPLERKVSKSGELTAAQMAGLALLPW
jgi:hypothetical protein